MVYLEVYRRPFLQDKRRSNGLIRYVSLECRYGAAWLLFAAIGLKLAPLTIGKYLAPTLRYLTYSFKQNKEVRVEVGEVKVWIRIHFFTFSISLLFDRSPSIAD